MFCCWYCGTIASYNFHVHYSFGCVILILVHLFVICFRIWLLLLLYFLSKLSSQTARTLALVCTCFGKNVWTLRRDNFNSNIHQPVNLSNGTITRLNKYWFLGLRFIYLLNQIESNNIKWTVDTSSISIENQNHRIKLFTWTKLNCMVNLNGLYIQ